MQSNSNQESNDRDIDPSISVVSFFSGCGGLDLGLLGGFRFLEDDVPSLPYTILMAYDQDTKCVDTYKANIHEAVEVRDLASYAPSNMPEADLLAGGFPCQDFAMGGPRRGLDSDRGRLYESMIRYLDYHRPKMILAENVPGLSSLQRGQVLNTILSDIETSGYKVAVWTLFAPDYGVPQRRTRLFIVGVRDDLVGFPSKPTPQFAANPRSIKWAIDDLATISDESIANQSQYFRASKAKKGNGQGDELSIAHQERCRPSRRSCKRYPRQGASYSGGIEKSPLDDTEATSVGRRRCNRSRR